MIRVPRKESQTIHLTQQLSGSALRTNRTSSYLDLLIASDVVAGAIGSASPLHGLGDLFDRVSRHFIALFLGCRQRARRWLNVPSTDGCLFFGARASTRPGFHGGVDTSHDSVDFR
jgi:hypothetical protein